MTFISYTSPEVVLATNRHYDVLTVLGEAKLVIMRRVHGAVF